VDSEQAESSSANRQRKPTRMGNSPTTLRFMGLANRVD